MSVTSKESDLKTLLHVVFGSLNGYVAFRSFPENGNKSNRPILKWVKADEKLIANAASFSKEANNNKFGFYVIPGTVGNIGEASSKHVLEMQSILVDIDDGNTEENLQKLTKHIGKPTLVVESGGITKGGHTKLHVYWQLVEKVTGEKVQQIADLRRDLALAIDGDIHFKSLHQPIRVAGSTYHKNGSNKLVKIRSYNPEEYELESLKASINKLLKARESEPDFQKTSNNANKKPIKDILTEKVYAGGSGKNTRFNAISRVTGYFFHRHFKGFITEEEAIKEIYDYNFVNVVPSLSETKLKSVINGIKKTHLKKYGSPLPVREAQNSKCNSFSLNSLLTDKTPMPEDIIAPRILTPSGLLVIGGAPKVGKSDFLLSLFTHLAAGKEFLGFKPPKPLKIFYFQTEIGYDYLRERIQRMNLSAALTKLAEQNLYITSSCEICLNQEGINQMIFHIKKQFPESPDIIAIDPLRNIFDGGKTGATENENDSMLFFLKQRIGKLRDEINPKAGIILVHHTKKITTKQLEEEPFQAFSGASSLRSYYTAGILIHKLEETNGCKLVFELRNGDNISDKLIVKNKNGWQETNIDNLRIAFKKKGTIFDQERERRLKIIIKLLEKDALKGHFYLMKQFAEKFQNYKGLGGKRSIYNDCSIAATKGILKFFDNPEIYNLDFTPSGFGFMCTKNMTIRLKTKGQRTSKNVPILATHYKCSEDGKKKNVENSKNWELNTENNQLEDQNEV